MLGVCALLLLGSGSGCSDDEPPAKAPSGGGGKAGRGGSGGIKPPPFDAGGDEEDEDAGPGGAGSSGGPGDPLAIECESFPAEPFGETTIGDFSNAVADPTDFVVTRKVASWDGGCDTPTVMIVLSDGTCPEGGGHELAFFLDANGIMEGTVGVGMNVILPEGPGIGGVRVRYTRPSDLEPAGTWGSCTSADGLFSVMTDDRELDVNDLDNIQAMFQLTLTPCDGSAPGVQNVKGSLNVDMRRSLDDVCK